ncbi:hypothetical protein HF295_01450 [Hujiaoplasma nucleasis]|uniref:Lon proteolytic domain-containing protein n=1 Tax=Hujiaoplasma nucleasis TaxID=2725268 RepID=A0A7L6N019_9MOLU|nr:S16 family serine protease [Hujiaoplasma nucleasis]QLY39596.1 hypothetical protein HF295_01450 [Hujiaoplasma nucleasis]
MKKLSSFLWPSIRLLIIPYLIFIFLMVYRIDYEIQAPGGISEVDQLIQVDYPVDEIKGSLSSTYIVSFTRPSIFQFIISDFSKYNQVNIIPESYRHYTDSELRDISYMQKVTSVDAAVIVAYIKASQVNEDIIFTENSYRLVTLIRGKEASLSNYNDIGLGHEFISMIGDEDIIIEDYTKLRNAMSDDQWYTFNFKGEEVYQVQLRKVDIEENYLLFSNYYLVDQADIYPKYIEKDSNIGGPSGGLLQTLSIYNMLVKEDITKGYKIAGTGTIRYDGTVGYVGGIKQKIATAYVNKVDMFFIPAIDERYSSHNYLEALAACEEYGIDPEGWLIPVASIDEAIVYLEGLDNHE